jgi:apolipoprotein N-acyltransferase
MNEQRALRQLFILFSVCWIALVLFAIHFHWSHRTQRAASFMWTAGFALFPPISGYLLFRVVKWCRLQDGPG